MVVSKNIERIWIQIRKHNADPVLRKRYESKSATLPLFYRNVKPAEDIFKLLQGCGSIFICQIGTIGT